MVNRKKAENLPVMPADGKVPDDPYKIPTRAILTWEGAGFTNTTSGWRGEFTITPEVIVAIMNLFSFAEAIGKTPKDLSLASISELARELSGSDWPTGSRALNSAETRAFIGRAIGKGLYYFGKSAFDGAKSIATNDYNSPVLFPEERLYALFSTDKSLELFDTIISLAIILNVSGVGEGYKILANMLRSSRIPAGLIQLGGIVRTGNAVGTNGIRVVDVICSGREINFLVENATGETRFVTATAANADRLDLAAAFRPSTKPIAVPKAPTVTFEPTPKVVNDIQPARIPVPKPSEPPTVRPGAPEWRKPAPTSPLREPLPQPRKPTPRPEPHKPPPNISVEPAIFPEWVDPGTAHWIRTIADYLAKQSKEFAGNFLKSIADPRLRAAVQMALLNGVHDKKPTVAPKTQRPPATAPKIVASSDDDKKGTKPAEPATKPPAVTPVNPTKTSADDKSASALLVSGLMSKLDDGLPSKSGPGKTTEAELMNKIIGELEKYRPPDISDTLWHKIIAKIAGKWVKGAGYATSEFDYSSDSVWEGLAGKIAEKVSDLYKAGVPSSLVLDVVHRESVEVVELIYSIFGSTIASSALKSLNPIDIAEEMYKASEAAGKRTAEHEDPAIRSIEGTIAAATANQGMKGAEAGRKFADEVIKAAVAAKARAVEHADPAIRKIAPTIAGAAAHKGVGGKEAGKKFANEVIEAILAARGWVKNNSNTAIRNSENAIVNLIADRGVRGGDKGVEFAKKWVKEKLLLE